MILQALYRLSETENLVPNPDFPLAPVAWLVAVSPSGKLLQISGTHVMNDETSKRRPRAKSFPIPRTVGRTSGDAAQFLCDKSEYVFGRVPDGPNSPTRTVEKLRKRNELFRDR